MEKIMGSTCVLSVVICVYILTVARVSEGQGMIVTPPPDTGRPVVANGIVYYLNYINIPAHCMDPRVSRYPTGAVIRDRRAFMKSDNPHIVNGNLEIAPSGCVYIEPGTEFRFGPGFGIIINGTLISRGSDEPGGRILMTKNEGPDNEYPAGNYRFDARLVDGNTTQDGQLNLLYKSKWRGVCTNYVNFTEVDANVTCRNLGFLKGNFTYHSFARNYTDYMLFERPGCSGSENSLLDCSGSSSIQVGPHICDGQQLVGFKCEGLAPGLAVTNWRGLEFYNSSVGADYTDDNVYVNKTYSWIEYTDIWYAGLDIFHGKGAGIFYQRASISASPYVPVFNNVTVLYGAYDGFNLTQVEGDIHIANCTVQKNRGMGMFIQTAVGNVLVNMTNVTDNWGDGIKMYMWNLTYYDFNKRFPPDESFCNTPILKNQVFPLYEYQEIIGNDGSKAPSICAKSYETTGNKRVVVHFMELIRDPAASGNIEVRERSRNGPLIGNYKVTNGSFPQSITTKSQKVYIRLTVTLPSNNKCETFKPCIRMLLRITTTKELDNDFSLIYSQVSNNNGYGVNIQDMRSKVFFNTSEVCFNGYGAGIRVYQGAGEVTVNNTLIEGNQAAGINITYSGGFQLLNRTRLIGNKGYGMITEYLLLNKTRIEAEQRLEVVRSEFQYNEWRALRIGNYCRGGLILVNTSSFSFNLDEAIEYLSCNVSTPKSTNFSVAFNKFDANLRHAIFVKPMVNTVGIITNNTFQNHSLAGILIDNGYDLLVSRWYRNFEVNYNIFENTFVENRGRYAANMRLTQDSPFQKLNFKFNKLIDNYIEDSFMYLNPRSRANAVVVVSSDNIIVQRNWIQNPKSVREIATHLVDPSGAIIATENWWGIEVLQQDQLEPIHKAVFDQDDRYNLAEVKYYPVLKTQRLYDNIIADNVPRYLWPFSRAGNVIGGVLEEGDFQARDHTTYRVDRDIFIMPGRSLLLGRGAVLEFDSSVGMVVHGCLRADGHERSNTVRLKLWENPDILPMENRTAPVRLVDGLDEYEGRLEVEVGGVWGTVCNKGWTEEDSLLACQQLGLIYNPEMPTATQKLQAPVSQPIFLSWVACEEVDVDVRNCHSVKEEHGCTHSQDVFLRCQPSTWAGITMPATPKDGQSCVTQIRHLAIDKAGLLDPATMSYTPALRIDYNYYKISYINVTDPLSDGIHIKFNHPHTENMLEYGTVHNGLGNGIVLRNSRMNIFYSTAKKNRKAGFLFDPFFTEYDALLVRNSIYFNKRTYLEDTPSRSISDRGMIFLLTRPGSGIEDKTYWCELSVSYTFRITLQILDYSPLTNIEEVTVYDMPRADIQSNSPGWKIEKDLIDFPVVSSRQHLTIKLRVRGVRTGRLSFAVISYQFQNHPPVLQTHLRNCTFDYNYQGIVTKHYNNPSNHKMELYHRHKLESFLFERINVFNSEREAMFMPSVTKYNEEFIPTWEEMTIPQKVATIEYNVTQCQFINNKRGILAEHNHVDFANNVWHWTFSLSDIKNTKNGGFEVEFPRVNDEEGDVKRHSIEFTQNEVSNNENFAFKIAGYYARVAIKNSNFVNNLCTRGLMIISGMEKDINIESNKMESNSGVYVLDLDIISHSEFSESVTGMMKFNQITQNRYFPGQTAPDSTYNPKTFALAFRGLQHMQANRNLFDNPELGFELVAATTALSLGNTINVKENWWGSTNVLVIRERIFDFDDWNNYAIATYHPYLTRSNINSDPAVGPPVDIPMDQQRLGGRITKSRSLPYQPEPYLVVADVTIMPGVTLAIPPGTELQFRPNVGILVLGKLEARGLPFSRIKMKPMTKATRNTRSVETREKRQTLATMRLRGDGSLYQDQGFLEMYNASTQNWNIMCDNQFNEKTAEVVCRALGKETINVRVRFTHLYDHYIYGKPSYFLKEFWAFSYYCRGDESSLDQCEKRYNYNLLPCIYAANYTFITCGARNLEAEEEYWGNIRFATDSYQEKFKENSNDDRYLRDSYLEYVDIEGAGMLHDEKVGAIQTTYVTPIFSNINITKCASNGYDVIAPRELLTIQKQNITNNLGFGINVLVLNGESSNRESSFTPLGISTIPYNVFGLVDICKMEKEITLDNRMILFYKYSNKERDCVKIIRSSNSNKRVGVRILQLNLFQEDFSRNSIEIFDGRDVSRDNLLIEILPNTSSSDVLRQFTSTGNTVNVHIHASVSFHYYGFVAEVITVPPTGLTYPDSNYRHELQEVVMHRNQDGAIQYKNVGEINPSLFIRHCWLDSNGVAILNLTSPPTIDISLQGTLLFDFSHNFVGYNKGGMYLSARTKTIATALRGNITNNVFAYGSHGEALNISGHYYQRIFMFQNYIYNYTAGDYRDVVHIKNVVVNFTYNVLAQNMGHYILAAYNHPDPQARQEYTRCGFNDNNATALYESTIKVGTGRPVFHHNYLVNSLNDFELQADIKESPNESPINATQNWWGSERKPFINGKILDEADDPKYAKVDFIPPKIDNRSVVDGGQCKPGWKLDKGRCYRYMGAALPYQEAINFCMDNGGFLADLRGDRGYFLRYLVRLMRPHDTPKMRVWVSGNVRAGMCGALELDYLVIEDDCTRLLYPFVCERDPFLVLPPEVQDYIRNIAIGIGVGIGGLIIIVVIIIAILWFIKSRRREKERFERAASIRSSIRGSVRSKSQLTMLSVGTSRGTLKDFDDETSRSYRSYATKSSQNGSLANSMHSIQSIHSIHSIDSAPRPAVGRTIASIRAQTKDSKGYRYEQKSVEEDDGFDDTFDDDDEDDMEDVKVSLENAGGPVYNSSHVNHQGQAPRVRNGHIRRVGSDEVAYNYDHGDEEEEEEEEEDDEEDQKSYHKQSLSSFSAPESPEASPIKNTIFLPRSNTSLNRPDLRAEPLPTPPPTPPVQSRYGNVPGYRTPEKVALSGSTSRLYDDVPSETSSDHRYGNVPGYKVPQPQLSGSTSRLYDDVPSETSSDHRYGNVPGPQVLPQSLSGSKSRLYDDVPSESSSDHRYGHVPGYNTAPQRATPDLYADVPSERSRHYGHLPGYEAEPERRAPPPPYSYHNVPFEAGNDDRYSSAPTYRPLVAQKPQVVPRTRTPEFLDRSTGTPRSNTPQLRDSPIPSPRTVPPRSEQSSPAPSQQSREHPVPPSRPEYTMDVPSYMVAPSPSIRPPTTRPPVTRPPVTRPPTTRPPAPHAPYYKDKTLYLQGRANENSVETEI